MARRNVKSAGEQPIPQDPAAVQPVDAEISPAVFSETGKAAYFPVVGIGASAGGLEAIEQFLSHVPANSGMAFVIVQHLDPDYKGSMPEISRRITPMQVIQVRDRTTIQPDCVYLIPPNKDMSLLHGRLHLLDPVSPRGLRLPIDIFFRSLAVEQGQHSVGVILSGMGTDGTLGLKAIREKGGVVLVQDPAAAKFDSMPRSAIDNGLADVVAAADQLPGKLVAYFQHVPHSIESILEGKMEQAAQSALEKVVILLRAVTGQDFSQYKKSTLYRRIERRMGLHQLNKIGLYARYLGENPQEVTLLFKELLIGVTNFFRDPAAWEYLKEEALPALLASRPDGAQFRAWTPACSTGEEAYSLAIIFKEALEKARPGGRYTLQIFATDLDKDAIGIARQGRYPANIASDVSPERLQRFFTRDDNDYLVNKEIREMVIFAPQNVIMDPPFTKMDVLICRNLLIYLAPELQKKLLPLFHYSLNPGGLLFLGSAETAGPFPHLFAALEHRWKIYRRKEAGLRPDNLDFPSAFFARADAPEVKLPAAAPNLQTLADQALLQHFTPAAVLVNERGDILYINGHTGDYLEPAAGRANWNIYVMAREGLRYELSGAFLKAKNQVKAVICAGLKVKSNDIEKTVDLTVQALQEPQALRGMFLVVFTQAAAEAQPPAGKAAGPGHRASAGNARLNELEDELRHVHQELQLTREEMQNSLEEQRSTNEELQSANEELQSTNEELTTSKEELQSLNEEMQTVNAELQSKVDDLSRANNDMKNLLNSTNIATLFLDEDLRVRRFSAQATHVIKLIPGDIGRPVTDLTSDLDYPDLAADVSDVLRTLVFVEKEVTASNGRWFTVRIMPYRTLENRIDGVVITFADISAAKKLEEELTRQIKALEARLAELAAPPPAATAGGTAGDKP